MSAPLAEPPRSDPAPAPGAGRPGWRLAVVVLLLHAVAAAGFRIHNLDLGLHLATGEWILDHGEVPTTNVLSDIHQDHPSVHDKWGFQVLAHLLVDGSGPDAAILVRIGLVAGLALLMLATARGLGAAPGPALLLGGLVLLACRNRFLFRPDLVSLVLLALVLWWCLVHRPDGRRGWPLLGLALVWVNLHGYFVLGPLAVGAVGVGHLLRGRSGRGPALRWFGLAAGMLAVGLANPAGVDGLLHPLRILQDLGAHEAFYRASIVEFTPTFGEGLGWTSFRLAYLVLLGALVLLGGWELLARRRGAEGAPDGGQAPEAGSLDPDDGQARDRTDRSSSPGQELATTSLRADAAAWGWPLLVPLALFAVMSTSLQRNIVLFAVLAGPVLAVLWTRRLGRLWPRPVAAATCVLVLAAGEASDALSIRDGLPRRTGLGWSSIAYPDAGIAFVAEHLPQRSVFTAFRYGSTFTGRRRPDQRAATNGNTHGYPTAYLIEVMAATSDSDPTAFRRLAAAHGHDAALVPMAAPLAARLLRDPDWTLVLLGRHEAVFVRASAVERAWLERHDLEARLAAGELPDLPVDECDQSRPWWRSRPPPATTLQAAGLLSGGGHLVQAAALVDQALESAPADGAALALRGLLHLRAGERPRARQRLEQALSVGCPPGLADQARRGLEQLGED